MDTPAIVLILGSIVITLAGNGKLLALVQALTAPYTPDYAQPAPQQ